jgi:NTE family protein
LPAHKKKTALVLGSGGARGLAHIGVIKALKENHIPIDMIAGTSIGAFVGGLYACGMEADSIEEIVCRFDKLMVAKFLIPKLFSSGFIDSKKVADYIGALTGKKRIEELDISFASVATNLITGEQVVFKKGLLVDAIMASISIPAIFEPANINGQYLVDGGLSNPLPISVAIDMKASKIIAVNVSPHPKRIAKKIRPQKTDEALQTIKKFPSIVSGLVNDYLWTSNKNGEPDKKNPAIEMKSNSPNLFNAFFQTFAISTHNLMAQHLRFAKPDILISPKVEDFDMLEFYKAEEIIKTGYNSAKKAMPDILAKII